MNESLRRLVRLIAFPILAIWLGSVVFEQLIGEGPLTTALAVVVGVVVAAVMLKKMVAGRHEDPDVDDY